MSVLQLQTKEGRTTSTNHPTFMFQYSFTWLLHSSMICPLMGSYQRTLHPWSNLFGVFRRASVIANLPVWIPKLYCGGFNNCQFPRPGNVPLLRALWSLLNCIWGLLQGSWGVLVHGLMFIFLKLSGAFSCWVSVRQVLQADEELGPKGA